MTFTNEPIAPERQAGADSREPFVPQAPRNVEESGLPHPFLFEMVLRAIYNRGKLSGAEIAAELRLPLPVLAPVLSAMRKHLLIDMVGQKSGSVGDAAFEYEIKPPKGTLAVEDALKKTMYDGPAPVPLTAYVNAVMNQTMKNLTVTRDSIQSAFMDLIVTPAVCNEIGPAVNSGTSIFLFGYPGNGKTAIAERITRLMGDVIYIPYALEVGGQLIKLYDPTVHELEEVPAHSSILRSWDYRYVKIKRPTIVTGGELILPMLDLVYNEIGRFYEAPIQMKANCGIFMIDDFGRQMVRPMDLLNRWIVPLEKRYDYLTLKTGNKIEVPFELLLIFSTNLDPDELVDEAFLRRIKYKIEICDPEESQWREIWRLVCRDRSVEYDDRGVDYLVGKWFRGKRPFRMCQPRDLLDQMISLAKFNMEEPGFKPGLIDAACESYFIRREKRDNQLPQSAV
jgi:predicted ATPase with chaperone activity